MQAFYHLFRVFYAKLFHLFRFFMVKIYHLFSNCALSIIDAQFSYFQGQKRR